MVFFPRYILFFPFLFLFDMVYCQPGQYWMLKNGSVTADEGIDICIDNSGNTYTTGYFTGVAWFGNVTLSSAGTTDIFIVKTNNTGDVVWAKSAGGFGPDKGLSVKTDINGNCYVTGFFYGTASFGGTSISSIAGSQDMFLAKYDVNGNFVWVTSGGGKTGDMGNAVTADRYGNVYITGQFADTAQFSGTTLISMPDTNFQSSIDAFIAKYNSSGNLLWIKKGSAIYTDRGMDICVDTLGSVYAIGQFSDTIAFDNIYNNNSFNATYLIKYDSAGTELWFRRMGGSSQNIAYGVALDANANIYLTGDCAGNIIFFGPTNFPFTSPYNYNVYIAKYNSNGDFLWFTSDGSSSQVSSRNIALDNSGNPHIVGNFRCIFSQYSDFYGAGNFNSIGFRDVFVVKYNTSGIKQWMRQCGGQKDDYGSGIVMNSSGQPIITGTYRYKMIFPGSPDFIWNTMDGYAYSATNGQYCSDQYYDDYFYLDSIGNTDIFIANAIDVTRQPYDYYKRNGSGCNRDYVGCCINNTGSDNTCSPDSIDVCDNTTLTAASNTSSAYNFNVNWGTYAAYKSPGPIFRYLWSTGDTTRNKFVSSSGTYSVTVTSIDSCFQSSDTIYVEVHPSPAKPTISDDVVINTNSLYPSAITLCAPDTVVLTGGNTGNNNYYWTGPGLPGSGLNQLSITVSYSGTYYFNVENSAGCYNYTAINVNIISFPPIVPKIFCDDSVTICEGDYFKVCIYDSLTNLPGCSNIPNSTVYWSVVPGGNVNYSSVTSYSSNYFYPTASGTYQIFATLIRNTICGNDTHYLDTSVYVIVNPVLTVTITGETLLCPNGDTITLTANASGGNSFNWNGSGIISNSSMPGIDVNQEGMYSVTVEDTLTGCNGWDFIDVSNKPQPTVTKNPPDGIVCPGDTVVMTVNLSGISYQWYGPTGLIPGATSQSYYDSITGFYYCVVIDNDSCELVSNSVELKQYATPFLIVTPNNMLCPGGSVTLEVITNYGSLLNWWAPLSGNQLVKTVASPGTYTCSVTSCAITTIVSTEITLANPVAEITVSDSGMHCEGDSVVLSGNSGVAGYEWSDGSQNPFILVYQSGSYSLTTTDNNGCTAVSPAVYVDFQQGAAPPVVSPDTTVCSGASVTLNATASNTIEWFDTPSGDSVIATGNSFTTPAITAITTYYVQTADSVCNSLKIPVTIFIDSASVIPAIYSNSPVCEGDTLLIATDYISGATYLWNGPDGFSSSQEDIQIEPAMIMDSGEYFLIVSDANCTSPQGAVNVAVFITPQITGIFSNSPLCEGDTLKLSTDTITNGVYSWTGPVNFNASLQNPFINNVVLSNSGEYHLTVSLNGCTSKDTMIAVIVAQTPVISGAEITSPICAGDTLFLFADSIDGANYNWTGPNQYISFQQNPVITNADILLSGQYSVYAMLGNCESASQNPEAIVYPLPVVNLGNDTIICDSSAIILNAGTFYSDYIWQDNSSNYSLVADDEGIYYVLVTDSNGCNSSDTINISISDCAVSLPRIFTPNGDGANDYFRINGIGLKNLHVIIFNRWGQKIYEWDGIDGYWDGKIQPGGELAPEGVYYYVAALTDFYDSAQKNYGYFHLIR